MFTLKDDWQGMSNIELLIKDYASGALTLDQFIIEADRRAQMAAGENSD